MAKKTATKAPLPEMRCFLACDAVSTDPNTGKKSLYGLFDTIWGADFPGAFRPFAIFIRLVGSRAKRDVTVEARGTDGRALPQTPLAMEAKFEAAEGAELVVHLAGLEMPKPGNVRFLVKCDGNQIGWPCVIHVKKAAKK
jgi:hypothetical protein